VPVGEEAEVTDAHEAARQQVKQKAAQELIDGQSQTENASTIKSCGYLGANSRGGRDKFGQRR
jgi:hypothetical protein